ncbi:MAG: glucosamine-6-phosphate deaminase [Defluviitaleaceae bacterium]|nr:glucosamine-6-phosphate deaminase [Defluviitaleaceae bacterium]
MTIIVAEDYETMSHKAAEIFAESITANPNKSFGFATGATPVGMYKNLVKLHKQENLDFSGVSTFNLDEYHPLAPDSPQSYRQFMYDNLFSHVNINKNNIFIPDSKAADPHMEAKEYEAKIENKGGIEMQILGIGLNGHIGFNEPNETFDANTRYTPLAKATIESNARHFASAEDVPTNAITMGIRSIMLARHILLLANGVNKATILRDALLGAITPLVPASILQLHQSVTVVIDKEAATLL